MLYVPSKVVVALYCHLVTSTSEISNIVITIIIYVYVTTVVVIWAASEIDHTLDIT